jgi:methionyl-tRNA formyltransferase
MPGSPLRLIFAGTPAFASTHLEALIDSEHQLLAVYTQPDRPAGRGRKLQASPVKAVAAAAGIPVRQPPSLRDENAQRALAELGADAMVVVAYGLILPQPVLDAPRLGCVNVHASLLPRWRGAAPIQRAIEAGDETTGITIMQMDAGLDTGAMLATAECAIGQHTAASLHDRLAELGPPLLLSVLDDLEGHLRRARAQDDDHATYAHKIEKAEGAIDWTAGVLAIERRVRAFNPFPVCFSELGGERVRIWEAWSLAGAAAPEPPGTILRADDRGIVVNCGDGQLAIGALQLPGGKRLGSAEVLRARAGLFAPGSRFVTPPSSRS